MKPRRPYLLRALHEWICDSDEVPYLLADATMPGVDVPLEHVKDGKIVLSTSASATLNFYIGDEFITFSGRFNGVSHDIVLPIGAVLAIYARDSGQGLVFDEEPELTTAAQDITAVEDSAATTDSSGEAARGRPQLKLVD